MFDLNIFDADSVNDVRGHFYTEVETSETHFFHFMCDIFFYQNIKYIKTINYVIWIGNEQCSEKPN